MIWSTVRISVSDERPTHPDNAITPAWIGGRSPPILASRQRRSKAAGWIDRRINRAGNSRARKTMVQLAWLWLRYQPESGLAQWFRGRVGELQGRTRRIAIVAMARKLLIAIWRFITVVPEGAILTT
jgi:hypothetical protein